MRHCCQFCADDIYYLNDTENYSSRKLYIGFCPICGKPVAEIVQWRFDGICERSAQAGIRANDLMLKCKNEIAYSLKELNYSKFKSKPFGWKFGINKEVKSAGKNLVKQYACDFYGNKELIKSY